MLTCIQLQVRVSKIAEVVHHAVFVEVRTMYGTIGNDKGMSLFLAPVLLSDRYWYPRRPRGADR